MAKKKALLGVVCLAMVALIAVFGTVAFLTDRDAETNVFTSGDVAIDLTEDFSQGSQLLPGVAVDKEVTITNTGKNAAWVWYTYAIPVEADKALDATVSNDWIALDADPVVAKVNGVDCNVYTRLYATALEPNTATPVDMTEVILASNVDKYEGKYYQVTNGNATEITYDFNNTVIYVSAYAIQADTFETVQDAYAAYNKQWTTAEGVNNGTEYAPVPEVTEVATADELKDAIAEGGVVVLNADLDLDADETITVAAGKEVTLNLNGNEIVTESDATGANRNAFDVRGTMTVENGTITTKHSGSNMGWNNSTNVFNVTAGGVLNIKDATIKNLGGSDMAFCVHLNNWGEVTLNIENSTLESTYIAVRVFNSGNDMNNVTIKDTKLNGKYCFWVHNYTVADFGTQEKADAHAALLNFDILGNGNTYTCTGKAPILYGFTDSIYFDADGNEVE